MRIGIDVRELEKGKNTGIGRNLLNFLNFALENKKEWEFVLFGNQHTQIDICAPNLKKVFIPEHISLWWDQVQLPSHLGKERIDIFLALYFRVPIFIPCRFALIVYDLIPLLTRENNYVKGFIGRAYFKLLTAMAIKKADRVITVSRHSKEDIIKIFGAPQEKIEVIRLAVDDSYLPLKPNPGWLVSKYGVTKKFIFSLTNFRPHKNVETLIEAYHKLPQKIKNEYQLVLGGRMDRKRLRPKKMIKQLGLNSNTIFTDLIPEKDLPAIYSAAELFVFPSLYEGFGLPPLEAMACGTPVIASYAASLSEVIGDAGILVDPKNPNGLSEKMHELITDRELRDRLISKGLDRAKDFSVEQMASKILKVIEETYGMDPVR